MAAEFVGMDVEIRQRRRGPVGDRRADRKIGGEPLPADRFRIERSGRSRD